MPATSETVDTLRLATAGSVDDGKSTLIGRLLYDAKSILSDQLEHIAAVSHARNGNGHLDLALLTDGLRAEREQGITIDVAHRYFATPRRRFILADTPGHEQYTRNMVTGASTAEVAIVLVDARKGVIEQTRRHAAVAALLGVRPRRARGQQDGPRRLVRGGLRPHRGRLRLLRLEGRARRGVGAADERAARRQRGRELVAAGLVRGPAAARAPRDGGAARGRARRPALPGAVGAARPRAAAAARTRAASRAASCGRAPRSSRCPRAHARAWSRSRRSTGRWRRPRRASRCRCGSTASSTSAAATCSSPPSRRRCPRARSWPTSAGSPTRGLRPGARLALKHGTATVRAVVDEVVDRLDLTASERARGARRPRAQRHRPRAPPRLAPVARRALRRQPRHRRVRPDRRGHERHRRRGHGRAP